MAFRYATQVDCSTIHVFGDSTSALETIFDVRPHGQQAASVRTCTLVAAWLDASPTRRIEIHWIPSHTGIRENELIDKDVQQASSDDISTARSWLALRSEAKAKALASWRKDAHIGTPPAHTHRTAISCPADCPHRRFLKKRNDFWGRSWPDSDAFRPVRHTGKFPLTLFDGNALAARAIRMLTGHAPLGEYRARFHPDRPTHCDCWVGGLHTREHVVDECTWFDITPARGKFRLFTESLDPFPLISGWLRTFKGAFTFALAHKDQYDARCHTCNPDTWDAQPEPYTYVDQREMVLRSHRTHIGA